MTWYAASVIMHLRFKDSCQEKFPVWENIFLVNASSDEEALQKAELIGKNHEGDSDGSLSWEDRPAEWIYDGVRKLITVSNSLNIENTPDDGAEITYSQFEIDNLETIKLLVSGADVSIRYIE